MRLQHSSLNIHVSYTAGALILSRKCQARVVINLYQFANDAHILRNPFTSLTMQLFEDDGLLYVASKKHGFAICTVKEIEMRHATLRNLGTLGDYVNELLRQIKLRKHYRLA